MKKQFAALTGCGNSSGSSASGSSVENNPVLEGWGNQIVIISDES